MGYSASDIQERLDEAALRLLDRAIPDKVPGEDSPALDLTESAKVFDSVMKYFSPRLQNMGKKRTSTLGKLQKQLNGGNSGGRSYPGTSQGTGISSGEEAEDEDA